MFSLNLKILIYLTLKIKIALLLTEKVTMLVKYLDFINIFLEMLSTKLLKYFNINKYLIGLELRKQPFYKLIYKLRLKKLDNFKTYIKTNLVNSFICLSKLSNKTLSYLCNYLIIFSAYI